MFNLVCDFQQYLSQFFGQCLVNFVLQNIISADYHDASGGKGGSNKNNCLVHKWYNTD